MGDARLAAVTYVSTGGIVLQAAQRHVDGSNYRLGGPCIDALQDI